MRNKSIFSFSLLATLCVFGSCSLARSQCVTSSGTGGCPSGGAYAASSSITESNGYNTYVDNGVTGGWGVSPTTQTLTSNSPESWAVSADYGSSTHQMSYPDTDQNYDGEVVNSFANIVGTFNETTPHNSDTEEEVGFFLYLNNYANTVEIEHDLVNTTQCNGTTPVATNVTFGGSYGVATAPWDLCYNGSFYYWQLASGGETTWGESSGSVELVSMIEYLETNGYLPSSSTINVIDYGFMIYTTNSTQETFTLNSYSLINNASSSTPAISLSPGSLNFSATEGASNPAAQNVTVSNFGGGTLAAPTTSITYSSGSGWLSVNCTGSSAPYTCSTQPTTGSLSIGTYEATVAVSSSGATNSPQSYSVVFTVEGVGSPTISLSPTNLDFDATVGGSNPAAQNVTVSNSGGNVLASPTTQITYNSGSGWLAVTCTSSSAPYTCSNQVATGSLAAGTYNATVNVSSSGATNSPQSYTVAFTLSPAPPCVITGADSLCPSSGLYYDTALSPTTWGEITQNDVWSPPSTWSQTMYTTSPGNWYIEANFPTDTTGAIHSYASAAIQYYQAGQTIDPLPTLDSFSEIVGSFSESAPAASTGTVSDIGYDMWLNNWADEIMIQHQNINTDVCTDWTTVIATHVAFGGSNGVPVEYWNLCQNGTFTSTSNPELIWQYYAPAGTKTFGESSGTVDIYAMLKYLEGNDICKTATGTTDCLPAGANLVQFGYGFEISTTDGNTQQFSVNNWTQTTEGGEGQVTPTVSAWPTASAIASGQTLASSTLGGGTASVAGTFAWTSPSTIPAEGTDSESVTFTPTDATDYTTVTGSVTVTVTASQVTPTVSAWPTASVITSGETLASSTLSGGTASVPGTFAWTSTSTIPAEGTDSENVTFTPTDATDYATVTGSVTVTVNPAPPPTMFVSVAPLAAQVGPGGTQTFTAYATPVSATGTIANDSTYGGVTWTATAGTFSTTATTDGVQTTWTAPETQGTYVITATNTYSGTVTATATVTVTTTAWEPCTATNPSDVCGGGTAFVSGAAEEPNLPYAPMTGGNGTYWGANVQNGFWNSAAAPTGSTQTLYASGVGNWYAVDDFESGNTAVETYPNSDAVYDNNSGTWLNSASPNLTPLVSSFSSITGSFEEGASLSTQSSGTSAEGAFDMWFNHYGNEVMIWFDMNNRSLAGCSNLSGGTNISFGGPTDTAAPGVPLHVWNVCSYGGKPGNEIVWYPVQSDIGEGTSTVYGLSSGSADIYSMLMWLETNEPTLLPTTTTLDQIEYGYEIASTGGQPETFTLSGFSVTTNYPTTPIITWPAPEPITYSTVLSSAQLNASSTVAGSFSYSPAAGTVLPVGTQTLTVTFTPTDTTYAAATQTVPLTVNPAILTVAATNETQPNGVPPALAYTISGFVNGDTSSVVSGAPILSTTATATSLPGTYPILIQLGTLTAANYTFDLSGAVDTVTDTGSVPASGSTCNGSYNGTFNGNVTVSAGQTCIFDGIGSGVTGNVTQTGGVLEAVNGAVVTGNLQQSGGSATVTGGTIDGNLQSTNGGSFAITAGSSIEGNLQTQGLPAGSPPNEVCASTVHRNLQYQQNDAGIVIGDGNQCGANTIGGNLTLQNNGAGATASVVGNTIGGNLTVQQDQAAATITNNTLKGNLTVQSNSGATIVDGNTVQGNLQDHSNTASTDVSSDTVGGNLQCQSNTSITGGKDTAKGQLQGQCSTF